jgi:F420-dependent oxidoreductase-like protein
MVSAPIRFGVQTWTQRTTWAELKAAWKLIDALGYDTAWTWDHFYPIEGEVSDPCLEGWMTLAALAAETSRVKVGVLVTGNTYRHPALLAKMGATLDHTSGGRLILGLGAAWYEREHQAYGIPFYTTAERIHRLDEAADIIIRLWTEKQTTYSGRYYRLVDAYCEPKPVQRPRPPVLIGGAGEKLTLGVVARHADIWNTFGSPETFRRKISVLAEHCRRVGRAVEDIEICWAGAGLITSSETEKRALVEFLATLWGGAPEEIEPATLIGSPQQVVDRIGRFLEEGVSHFIVTARPPFDHRFLETFAQKVIPQFRC